MSEMKKNTLLFLIFIINTSYAQQEMIDLRGIINFEASVPLFEEVKAITETSTCKLNTKTGALSTFVVIENFHFKIPLMEKHFNENYLESKRYPKAIFKGKIQGFNFSAIKTDPKGYTLKGKLFIHGVSKDISVPLTIKKSANGLEIRTNFSVYIKDFNIKIPKVLSVKIAEKVTINSFYLLH
jgi:hypothetical protein